MLSSIVAYRSTVVPDRVTVFVQTRQYFMTTRNGDMSPWCGMSHPHGAHFSAHGMPHRRVPRYFTHQNGSLG